MALALDATTLGTLYRLGAQRGLSRLCHPSGLDRPEQAKHAWRREWLRMLRQCAGRFPGRGRSSCWPIGACTPAGCFGGSSGWGGTRFCASTRGHLSPQGQVRGGPEDLGARAGHGWQGTGIAFKGRHRQLHCTLLACWEAGYKDPWLILTDLPPEASTACWYGLRAWIEQGLRSPSARAGSGSAPT